MLRVLDDRARAYAAVRPAQAGTLRVRTHVPGRVGDDDLTGLRVLLIADLLARTAELAGLQAFASRELAGQPGVEEAADALNIHPPATDAATPADVHVASGGIVVADGQPGIVLIAAPARLRASRGEVDPLGIRLALLSYRYSEPAEITEAVLADASATLGQWRRQVARWADSPSRPIPEPIVVAARDAFDNLDTVSALTLLRGLAADGGIPAGAKFETFVFADRVLGLDLAREIGRV